MRCTNHTPRLAHVVLCWSIVAPTARLKCIWLGFQLYFNIHSQYVMYLVYAFSSILFSISLYFQHVQIMSLLNYTLFSLYVFSTLIISYMLSTLQALMHTLHLHYVFLCRFRSSKFISRVDQFRSTFNRISCVSSYFKDNKHFFAF